MRDGVDVTTLAIDLARVKALLAEAAWRLRDDERARGWRRRVLLTMPHPQNHFTPPCPGQFNASSKCDEAHAHSLNCGDPMDVCVLCRRTNAEHRAAWLALE